MAVESRPQPGQSDSDMKAVLKTLKFKKLTLTENCDVGTSNQSNNHTVKNDAIPMDSAIFPPTAMGPSATSVSPGKSPRRSQEDDADQFSRKRRKVESTPPATRKYKRLPKEGWFLLDSEIPSSGLVWEPRGTPRQWTSSRDELYAAVSSLKTTVNGISMTKTTEIIIVVDKDSGIGLFNEEDPLVWKLKIKRGHVATLPTILPEAAHRIQTTAPLDTPNVSSPFPFRQLPNRELITPTEFSSGSVIHQESFSPPVPRFINRFPEVSPAPHGRNDATLDLNAPPRRLTSQHDASSWTHMNHGTYGIFPHRPTQDGNVLQPISAPPGASHGCVLNTANNPTTAFPNIGSQRPSAYVNACQPAGPSCSSADQTIAHFPNDEVIVSRPHEANYDGCIHLIPAPAVNEMLPPPYPYVDHRTCFDSFGNQWVEKHDACNSWRPFGTPSTHEIQKKAFFDKIAYSFHHQVKKGMDAAGHVLDIRDQFIMKIEHDAELPLHQFQHTSAPNRLRYDSVGGFSHFGSRNDDYNPHYGYGHPVQRLDPQDTQASASRLLTSSQTPTHSTFSECSTTPQTETSSFEATPEPPTSPLDFPLEIDKMVKAYKLGMPVIVIASQEILDHLGLKLPSEFGYAVLGCFQISSQQTLRDSTEPEYEVFEWQFSIRWMQGAEGQFFREGIEPELMSSPWWSHTKDLNVSSDCPDVLPLDLLNDSGMLAVGWYCHACGKINQQTLFRHSKCFSSFCKGKPAEVRPTVTLEQLVTNLQDKLGMANPLYLKAPNVGEAYNVEWEDGMRTLKYHLGDGRIEEQAICSHVFNGSSNEFQEEATDLFYDIQTEVELVLDGVFFQCTFSPSDWKSVMPSVKNAREWMLHMGHTYSDLLNPETTIKITSLSILAWWKEGSRKTLQPFLAKVHPIVVACLGQAITFTLKRVDHTTGKEAGKSPAKRTGKAQKQLTTLLTLDGGEADLNTLPKEKEPLQHDVVISMVHGDVLVLGGDDYEYQLKRHGAGIILIGTQ